MNGKIQRSLKRDPIRVSNGSKEKLVRFITNGMKLVHTEVGLVYIPENIHVCENEGTFNHATAMVYNLQKHKQRFKEVGREGTQTISERVSNKAWVAHVYEVSVKELIEQGKILRQDNRNFEIQSLIQE